MLEKIYKMLLSDPKHDSGSKSRMNENEFDIDDFLADVSNDVLANHDATAVEDETNKQVNHLFLFY